MSSSSFEARMSQAKRLKKLLEAIKDLTPDVHLVCSKTGLGIEAMDNLHTSLVGLTLDAGGFDYYRIGRTLSLGVHLPSLATMLQLAGDDDDVTLRAEAGGDFLSLLIEPKNQARISSFQLRLIDIETDCYNVREPQDAAIVEMRSAEFQRIVRELRDLGDVLEIAVSKDGVRFKVNGDTGSGSVVCKPGLENNDDDPGVVITAPVEVNALLAMCKVLPFTKATPLSKRVKLMVHPVEPLVITYDLGDGVGSLRFYLAPKLRDEDP